MKNLAPTDAAALEAVETREWLESLDYVLAQGDKSPRHPAARRAARPRAPGRRPRGRSPRRRPYINTIPPHEEVPYPGDREIERRIKSLVRWNALAMVVRANRESDGIGGHISTYASAATLYEVGLQPLLPRQGRRRATRTSSTSRATRRPASTRARFSRAASTRRICTTSATSCATGGGLSSYPHPWLMPDFWEFPTVSMGLGPLMAIYQARYAKYLENRGLKPASDQKVWAFLGDGETDEPEALGAITLASREKLDNLIFVINCNLQRLDGPVRGNGQIIQELEAVFRGAGWNVIKVLWGSDWDELLAQRHRRRARASAWARSSTASTSATSSRTARTCASTSGATIRACSRWCGICPTSDLKKLRVGGHDPVKVYNAYRAAVQHTGQPTVILARTIKGYGLGEAGEGKNITHQQKKMNESDLRTFRDRFGIPIPDDRIADAPFYRPDEGSPEVTYMKERRDGARRLRAEARRRGAGDSARRSTTSSTSSRRAPRAARPRRRWCSCKMLAKLLRDKDIGKLVVPIVPDEARTFGMESLFRARRHLLEHRPALRAGRHGHAAVLQGSEGRADPRGGHHRSGIDVVVHRRRHRVRDARREHDSVLHLLLDVRLPARRRLHLGRGGCARAAASCSAARPAARRCAGEGLQHQDGNSHMLALTVPTCRAYDPAYAYELAVIIEDGIKRMYGDGEPGFYYITVMNEQYEMPAMPAGARDGIIKGLYRFSAAPDAEGEGARAADRQRRDPQRSRQAQTLLAVDHLNPQSLKDDFDPCKVRFCWYYMEPNAEADCLSLMLEGYLCLSFHVEDTDHGSMDMTYLGPFLRDIDRLRAGASGVGEQFSLGPSQLQGFATAFADTIASNTPDGNFKSDLGGRQEGAPDDSDNLCDGWLELARVNSTVWVLCRAMSVRNVAGQQPYLRIGNHSVLLATKQFLP